MKYFIYFLLALILAIFLTWRFVPPAPSTEEVHNRITQNGLYDTFQEIPEPIKGGGGEGLAKLIEVDFQVKKSLYGDDCIYHYKTGECGEHWDYMLYLASKGHPKSERCPLCK